MYSDRVVGDRVARFCNGFGWCVRPEHRRYSVALLRPLGTRPGLTFTNLTQRSDLIPLFLKMGYELADERKYVSYPRVGALLARGADRVRLIPTEEVTESLLGRDAYRVHQDHIGRTVRRMVFEAGGEACLVVTKRVYEAGMRLGRSELFYASDKAFLERHFEQVKLGILRQDKTAGLHADARLLGFVPKGASWIPGTALFKSPSVSAEHIDALYSELVFLE
jgi:hypothetical protein